MAGVGGAAVPGRLSLAGTEARPTGVFSYKLNLKQRVVNDGNMLREVYRGGFKTRSYE